MNCKNCKAHCYWAGQDVTKPDHGNCYVGYVPKTNADRIRAMTDEELAEWINQHDCHSNLYGYDPKDAILDWLKQEVDNDTD